MAMGAVALPALMPSCLAAPVRAAGPMEPRVVQRPLVLWYSQTGYTDRKSVV